MPRTPRSARHGPDACYHVLNRGHARETLFHDVEDYAAFLRLLARYTEAAPVRLYHYCLLSNHFHLLVHFDRPDRLSPVMAGLLVAYWHLYRRRYGLVGHLVQGRFKSPVIDTDAYVLTCGRYIERNPVAAGLTADPWSYPWSSARAYALGEPNSLLSRNPWYESLSPDPDRRRQLWREFLVADDPREEVVRRDDWTTGDAVFRRRMSRMEARPAPRRRGRPGVPETPPTSVPPQRPDLYNPPKQTEHCAIFDASL